MEGYRHGSYLYPFELCDLKTRISSRGLLFVGAYYPEWNKCKLESNQISFMSWSHPQMSCLHYRRYTCNIPAAAHLTLSDFVWLIFSGVEPLIVISRNCRWLTMVTLLRSYGRRLGEWELVVVVTKSNKHLELILSMLSFLLKHNIANSVSALSSSIMSLAQHTTLFHIWHYFVCRFNYFWASLELQLKNRYLS